jgi:flagellar export protein FliJ
MTSGLHGAIRVAKASVDDRQRALAGLLRQAEDLGGQRLRISEEVAREREAASGVDGESVHFGPYVAAAIARCRELDAAAAAVEAAIDAARDALGEDYRHLRALELTEEARLRQAAEAMARREREALDEVGLQRHQRASAPHQSSPHEEKGPCP